MVFSGIFENAKVDIYKDISESQWYVENNHLLLDYFDILITVELDPSLHSNLQNKLCIGDEQNKAVAEFYDLPYTAPIKKMRLADIKKELGYDFKLID